VFPVRADDHGNTGVDERLGVFDRIESVSGLCNHFASPPRDSRTGRLTTRRPVLLLLLSQCAPELLALRVGQPRSIPSCLRSGGSKPGALALAHFPISLSASA
jgi:hypothetical protein